MIRALWTHKNTALAIALLALACIAGFAPPEGESETVGALGQQCQTAMQQNKGNLDGMRQSLPVVTESPIESGNCSDTRKIADRYHDGSHFAQEARPRVERRD